MVKTINLMGTRLIMLPEKALVLAEHNTLVIADWHLGKAMHFRKAGIFMPAVPNDEETTLLQSLIVEYGIRLVVLLGDLFHSELNSEWLTFARFRACNADVRFVLTRGNHDVLPDSLLDKSDIEVVDSYSISGHICCTHHPPNHLSPDQLYIAGHVHPGCLIETRGRQRYRLPCFYYHQQTLLLPAFGTLTGLHMVRQVSDASIYPIAGGRVWKLKAT